MVELSEHWTADWTTDWTVDCLVDLSVLDGELVHSLDGALNDDMVCGLIYFKVG